MIFQEDDIVVFQDALRRDVLRNIFILAFFGKLVLFQDALRRDVLRNARRHRSQLHVLRVSRRPTA